MLHLILLLSTAGVTMQDAEICKLVDGAVIVNDDDEYLGKIADTHSKDSIYNEYGPYGSKYRSESVFNEYGKNGSEYRSGSATNEFTTTPPRIIKNGRVIALLTKNKSLRGGIDPAVLGITCYDWTPE